MAQNTGAGQIFTTDNQVGRRTFVGNTTPAYPVAGDVWIDNTAGSSPSLTRWSKTAAGGETSFTGNDDNGITLAYNVGSEQVYLNGVLLVRGVDYVATNGSSITGLPALVVSDVVVVLSLLTATISGNIPLSTVQNKGDLISATGSGVVSNLPVGSNNSLLVADSTQAQGLRWTTTASTFTTWRKAATGGETSLTGTDDFAVTLSYTVGQELVYVNGVLLERAVDYTATNGTSVTLVNALVSGDIFTVISVGAFTLPNAIQLSQVTAKGDLIVANGAATVTNLPVGTDGSILVSNSLSGSGVSWAGPNVGAGKNAIINGGFDNWQRGTSFVSTGLAYTADRFQTSLGTMTSGTITTTRQSAGLAGFNYALRFQRNSGATTTGNGYLTYSLDSLNTIALQGKTITVSFYARAGANYSPSGSGLFFVSNTGTGTDENINNGYTGQSTIGSTTTTLTTSWQRFSYTYSVSSTAQEIGFYWAYTGVGTAGANDYYDITGLQVEIGAVATPFSRAGGSIQGELAACQRYYYRWTAANLSTGYIANGANLTTSASYAIIRMPVPLRTNPSLETSGTASNYRLYNGGTNVACTSVPAIDQPHNETPTVYFTASGSLTLGYATYIGANSTTAAFLGFNAEL